MLDNPKEVKKTEFGTFPKDWRLVPIKELAKISTGDKNTEDKVSDGKYPFFVRSANVERINSCSFDGEAVLTAGDGVGTGKIFHYINGKFDYHQRVYKMSDFSSEVIGFYFYLCFSNYFYDRVMGMTAKSSVDSVRMDMIADMKIPLPPTLEEQQAIASTLSDVDELIRSLDGLIQKKQAIKKGAIQQLLTGKKRLAGFEGEWEVKKLGDVCQIISGGTPSTRNSEYWDGDIKWCTPTDITSNKGKYLSKTSRKITDQGLKNSSATLLPKGTLLLCSRATVGEVRIAESEISTNQGFKSLICSESVDNEFLYYLVILKKQKFIDKAFGSTFLEISKKNTADIEFDFPSAEEQKAIAQILSNMDRELQNLRQKREKYVQIKQGMMQELLTGRVRLV